VRNQTRAASSPATHAEQTALPGARKSSAGTSELQAQAARKRDLPPAETATSLMHLALTRPPGTFAPEIGSDY